jgi:lysine 2,3-aminomutase
VDPVPDPEASLIPDYTTQKQTPMWHDWQWQMRNSPREFPDVSGTALPFRITPYYADLIQRLGLDHPLAKTVFPSEAELILSPGEAVDPLGEEADSPVPGIVHRYPDRCLFLVTSVCSTYCRYCTRSRSVGHGTGNYNYEALEYIRSHTEIRDVVVSGGDPLTLPTGQLEFILEKLRTIRHVEMVRIGTKVPMVLPQRIDPDLCGVLKEFHPWISIHCTHPDELTPEAESALNKLASCGCPLGSQTVLLKGVNDDSETIRRLMVGLLKNRVRPYYLYQCDPVAGTKHFRTDPEVGVGILRYLQGTISGYGIPRFVIDAPGGGGKIPLSPNYVIDRDEGEIKLENWEGKEYSYPV